MKSTKRALKAAALAAMLTATMLLSTGCVTQTVGVGGGGIMRVP